MLLPRPAMRLLFAVDSTSIIQQRQVEEVPGDDQELLTTNPATPMLFIWISGNGGI